MRTTVVKWSSKKETAQRLAKCFLAGPTPTDLAFLVLVKMDSLLDVHTLW
jgi:hypothetical protein